MAECIGVPSCIRSLSCSACPASSSVACILPSSPVAQHTITLLAAPSPNRLYSMHASRSLTQVWPAGVERTQSLLDTLTNRTIAIDTPVSQRVGEINLLQMHG